MDAKPSITHRLVDGKRANIFHSSVYARAQSGTVIGAASTESFAKRREIDENRKNIRKYNDSLVAEQRFNPEAAGAARLDQPADQQDEAIPEYRQQLMDATKDNMAPDLGETQKTLADAKAKRAAMSARFSGQPGQPSQPGQSSYSSQPGRPGQFGRPGATQPATRPSGATRPTPSYRVRPIPKIGPH